MGKSGNNNAERKNVDKNITYCIRGGAINRK